MGGAWSINAAVYTMYSHIRFHAWETINENVRVPIANAFCSVARGCCILVALGRSNYFMMLMDMAFVALQLAGGIEDDEFSSFVVGIGVLEALIFAASVIKAARR